MEKFNQINTGMTYSQVVGIIGFDGTISSQTDAGKIYIWKQSNKYISIIFMDNKVYSKSQSGLSGQAQLSQSETQNESEQQTEIRQNPVATINIEGYGNIAIELYPDIAPNTVTNFIALANNGFYDNLLIHRVQKDFVIQGGDPKGDGTGGPTLSEIDKSIRKGSTEDIQYSINGEFTRNGYNNTLKHEKGVISMARADYSALNITEGNYLTTEGYNSAGSQFFICLDEAPSLDGLYAGFGKVISGMNVLDRIEKVELYAEEEGLEPSRPKKDIVISGIRVDTKGFEYGKPETHKVFDYQEWFMKYYYGG